jgi:hypothetical protein
MICIEAMIVVCVQVYTTDSAQNGAFINFLKKCGSGAPCTYDRHALES